MSHIHFQKHLTSLAVFVLLFVFSDVIIDILLTFTHNLIELCEYSFELLIEHFFHTDHHHSEIIMINFLLGLVFIAIFWIWLKFPLIYSKTHDVFVRYTAHKVAQWHHLSWIEQIELSSFYLSALSLFLFFFM